VPSPSISPFIHRKVVVLNETATVYQAVRAMCSNNIGSVVVFDNEGMLSGIVTDRDLACALASVEESGTNVREELQDSEIGDVMTRNPAWVGENATLTEVIALMKERGIRRVPVIHEGKTSKQPGEQRCIGMVSLDDLIVAKKISANDLAAIVRAQVFRRRKSQSLLEEGDVARDPRAENFIRAFARQFVHQTAGDVNKAEERARAFVDLVAGLVVRRLHFTSAANLIDHLPQSFRSPLLDLPAGPDRSITADRILDEIVKRFDVDRKEAKSLIGSLWDSLVSEQSVPSAADVAEELPDDIHGLLVELPEGTPRSEAGASEGKGTRSGAGREPQV
jgi:CBS domain-containing protein